MRLKKPECSASLLPILSSLALLNHASFGLQSVHLSRTLNLVRFNVLPISARLGLSQEQIISYCSRPVQHLADITKSLQSQLQATINQRRLIAVQDENNEPSPKRVKMDGSGPGGMVGGGGGPVMGGGRMGLQQQPQLQLQQAQGLGQPPMSRQQQQKLQQQMGASAPGVRMVSNPSQVSSRPGLARLDLFLSALLRYQFLVRPLTIISAHPIISIVALCDAISLITRLTLKNTMLEPLLNPNKTSACLFDLHILDMLDSYFCVSSPCLHCRLF